MKKITSILLFLTGITFAFAQEHTNEIFLAARTGTVAEVSELMRENPQIISSVDQRGFSPLIVACYRGNKDVARFLMDHVSDVNFVSAEGTALAALAIKYDKSLVEYLLDKNSDPNIPDATGSTPLFWAVKFRNKEMVRLLLQKGASTSHKDVNGLSSFDYAVKTNDVELINLLKN